MSPLRESLKLKDGKLFNLDFHNRRMNIARKKYFGLESKLSLGQIITIPEDKRMGLFRCRVTYSPEIDKIEFISPTYRKIKSLKLIIENNIDYQFKYADRHHLQKLYKLRGDCDDILIVKNGFVSDSFTANPVFFDGDKWWTPDTPLLAGTQREKLLEEGKLFACKITPGDLYKYEKVGLINAMQDMEDMPVLNISDII